MITEKLLTEKQLLSRLNIINKLLFENEENVTNIFKSIDNTAAVMQAPNLTLDNLGLTALISVIEFFNSSKPEYAKILLSHIDQQLKEINQKLITEYPLEQVIKNPKSQKILLLALTLEWLSCEKIQPLVLIALANFYQANDYLEHAKLLYENVIKSEGIEDKDKISAMYELAVLFKEDENEEMHKKGFELLRDIVEIAGLETDTAIELARCYIDGVGCKKDIKLAEKILLQLIEDKRAQFYLGSLYESNEKNLKKAIYWYTLSNLPAALNNLAGMYRDGRGCKQDIKKAVELYKSAEIQKGKLLPKALSNLVCLLFEERNNGRPQCDDKELIRLAKLSAEEDKDMEAQFILGTLFYEKKQCDIKAVINLFTLSAKQGSYDAEFKLGELYAAQANTEEAIFWYNCVVKNPKIQKNSEVLEKAWHELAHLYLDREDKESAKKCFENSIKGADRACSLIALSKLDHSSPYLKEAVAMLEEKIAKYPLDSPQKDKNSCLEDLKDLFHLSYHLGNFKKVLDIAPTLQTYARKWFDETSNYNVFLKAYEAMNEGVVVSFVVKQHLPKQGENTECLEKNTIEKQQIEKTSQLNYSTLYQPNKSKEGEQQQKVSSENNYSM